MSLTSIPNEETINRFGRYTMIQKIAHGGMATLYLARLDGPVGFEKFFAIKKIHPHLAEEREFVTMFLDEARFAAQIQHPNVVQIFELGEENGDYFFAMEYLLGESLAEVMKEMALRGITPPIPFLAHVIARTATGLHAAHELRGPEGLHLGLVHRDVSPHNILLTYDGEVKLLDFGIAKATGRLSQTATGELKGKYAYMSPEQLLGNREVDRRADIFSLGVVLYEATTLRRLFKAENELLTLDKISKCEVAPPTSFIPGFPRQLEAIILRTLQREPEYRYQTAAELAADLDTFTATSTEHLTTAAVSTWMTEQFNERAEEKRRILELARTISSRNATGENLGMSDESASRIPWFAYGVIAALLAFGLTIAALFFTSGPTSSPTGTLRVQSTPEAGIVSLNGGPSLGRTPLELAGLALGSHSIEVNAPGFEPRETSFSIQQAGQLVTVLVPLERIEVNEANEMNEIREGPLEVDAGQGIRAPPRDSIDDDGDSENPQRRPRTERNGAVGYLNLSTRPWAEVYVGGRKLGTTPLVKAKLPAGRRRLKLLPEGTRPARYVVVRIKAGQTIRKTLSF